MSSNGHSAGPSAGAASSTAAGGRKKYSIRPFRQHQPMDKAAALRVWEQLERAMNEIYNRNASKLSFEELYRNAYNLVLHKHGQLLYEGVTHKISTHLSSVAEDVSSKPDASLLEAVSLCWNDHIMTMVMIRDILMYMDRTYVMQSKKRPVYDLGLALFRDIVWEHPLIETRVTTLLLDNIAQERDGQIIQQTLMKVILGMLLELGGICSSRQRSSHHSSSTSLGHFSTRQHRHALQAAAALQANASVTANVYERDFEALFLDTTQEFYRNESSTYLSQNTAPDYVRKAQARLAEEHSRAQRYLAPTTEAPLINIVEIELVQKHAKTLVEMEQTGFMSLLKDSEHKMDELRSMYDLFVRVPTTVDYLREALASIVKTEGRALLQAQERGAAEPTTFVKGILAMRERYTAVVNEAFRAEKKTSKRLKESFEDVLNQDNRAANCLAIYVDELLRSGLKGYTEQQSLMEEELKKVILVFRYLQDKDVFELYYKQHLAKRLLTNKSISEEAEKAMVSQLKAECGYQFTSKLEGMFNDMRISKDTRDAYKHHVKTSNAATSLSSQSSVVDIEVDVLTTGYWPSQSVPQCTLPAPIDEAIRRFSTFYLQKHTGRKLSWQTSTGSAEVRATFGEAPKFRRHELAVTTYQMCILYLFNEDDTQTLEQIKEKTNIPEGELRRHLISLCTPKHRILRKASRGKVIAENDSFSFHKDYTSRMKRVKVPLVSMKETLSASDKVGGAAGAAGGIPGDKSASLTVAGELPKEVEEDRRHLVEAVVMRIMKARKTLHHNELIAEVTKQLQNRFVPRPQFVKKRVESLIERDYLERSEEDRRVYVYLA